MQNRLYETRVLRRLSQYVLALQTGIPQPRISIIQNGLVEAKAEEKKRLAKALNLKVEDVFPQGVTNEQGE